MLRHTVNLLQSPTLFTILGRGLQFVSQMVTVLVIPKILAPELYVQFNLAVSLSYLLASFVFGWLTRSLYRHVHEMLLAKGVSIRQTVFAYFFIVTVPLVIAFIIVASLIHDSIYVLLPLLLVVAGLKTGVISTLNAAEKHKDYFLVHLGFALSLGIFISMCALGVQEQLARYLAIYAFLDFSIAVIAWSRLGILGTGLRPHFDMNVARRYFRYGLPLVAHSVALWLISMSDRYLMLLWEPSARVADYILSYQLASSAITLPLNFAMLVIFPKVIRIDKEGGERAALDYTYRLLGYYVRYLPLAFILCCALVIPFKYYFYPAYEFHPLIIAIIILAHLIFAFSSFFNKEFELNRRTLVITKSIGIGAALNIVMNLVLIPLLGMLGAALATLAAYSATVLLVYRRLGYRPWKAGA